MYGTTEGPPSTTGGDDDRWGGLHQEKLGGSQSKFKHRQTDRRSQSHRPDRSNLLRVVDSVLQISTFMIQNDTAFRFSFPH